MDIFNGPHSGVSAVSKRKSFSKQEALIVSCAENFIPEANKVSAPQTRQNADKKPATVKAAIPFFSYF